MTQVVAPRRIVPSPQWALLRYVDHSCAVRKAFDVQVQLRAVEDPDTNGWVIQATLPPGVRIRACEHDGHWLVAARRGRARRFVTERSIGFGPEALVAAIKIAVSNIS